MLQLFDGLENGLVYRVDKVVEGVVLQVGVAGDVGTQLRLHNTARTATLPHLMQYLWCYSKPTLEEFYKVGDICKSTLRADLRNGLVRGD